MIEVAEEQVGEPLTYFEVVTAMALYHFQADGCGCGGP